MAGVKVIRGIDVSAIQGVVDWQSVAKAGIQFAFLRCSIGNEPSVDSKYAQNVRAARREGIAVAPYHFAFPLPHLSPKDQAQHAFNLAHVDGEPVGSWIGDLPPAYDHEWPPPEKPGQAAGAEWKRWGCTPTQLQDWGLAYLDEARRLWGVKSVLYTYPYWARAVRIHEAFDYGEYPLWMADYRGREPREGERPYTPLPWLPGPMFWQHDGNGGLRLPNGVDADFNVFCGTAMEFAALLGQVATCPRPTVDPGLEAQIAATRIREHGLMIDADIRTYRQERANG